ncbi:DUF2087 domain-containing protein [Leifsonia sp. NCR5]|uniref:DUF2087 domain-containing protein n=1 Tax=Leifsonia sp. NCR5 TaxID=1978342 RepID=UPI00211A3858|nr:DUF2087 domain-containing protein [Leifsonia sp. NCR5]
MGDWRRIVAALGNADARVVFAEVVLGGAGAAGTAGAAGAGLSPARRRRALAALTASGVVVEQDGALVVDGAVFADALRDAQRRDARGRAPRTGVERFLDADGRIDRFPANAGERRELLALVASAVLGDSEVVDERELSERLLRFGDDPALLRRYLVDFGLVERTRSGSEYAKTRA